MERHADLQGSGLDRRGTGGSPCQGEQAEAEHEFAGSCGASTISLSESIETYGEAGGEDAPARSLGPAARSRGVRRGRRRASRRRACIQTETCSTSPLASRWCCSSFGARSGGAPGVGSWTSSRKAGSRGAAGTPQVVDEDPLVVESSRCTSPGRRSDRRRRAECPALREHGRRRPRARSRSGCSRPRGAPRAGRGTSAARGAPGRGRASGTATGSTPPPPPAAARPARGAAVLAR